MEGEQYLTDYTRSRSYGMSNNYMPGDPKEMPQELLRKPESKSSSGDMPLQDRLDLVRSGKVDRALYESYYHSETGGTDTGELAFGHGRTPTASVAGLQQRMALRMATNEARLNREVFNPQQRESRYLRRSVQENPHPTVIPGSSWMHEAVQGGHPFYPGDINRLNAPNLVDLALDQRGSVGQR